MAEIRQELIERIREEISRGTYATKEKLEAAADRLVVILAATCPSSRRGPS